MKKLFASLLMIGFILSLTACGNGQNSTQASQTATAATKTAQPTSAPTQAETQPQTADAPVAAESPQEEIQQNLQTGLEEEEPQEEQNMTLQMSIGNTPVSVAWEDNDAVQSLKELCRNQPLLIDMSMYGGFEQVGSIGAYLPQNDVQTTTSAGDIVLYSGNQLVVFYGSNSWAYTRLGHITDQSADGMAQLLSNGDTTITIILE